MKETLKSSQFLRGIVHAFRQIKVDCRTFSWLQQRGRAIASYLGSTPHPRMQIGSGKNFLEGWLNVDFRPTDNRHVYLDATRPFPFADGSFEYVFSEHMIEHIEYHQAMHMLRECHRILKPGGRIRISTPNLRSIVSLLENRDSQIHREYIKRASDKYIPVNKSYRPSFVINNFFWDFGHFFVYDPETLSAALMEAGFTDIRQFGPGESDDVNLRGLESHGKVIGEDMNRFETMVLEGKRG